MPNSRAEGIQLDEGTVYLKHPFNSTKLVGVIGIADDACGLESDENELWVTINLNQNAPNLDSPPKLSFWLDHGIFANNGTQAPPYVNLTMHWAGNGLVLPDEQGTGSPDDFCSEWETELSEQFVGLSAAHVRCWTADSCADPRSDLEQDGLREQHIDPMIDDMEVLPDDAAPAIETPTPLPRPDGEEFVVVGCMERLPVVLPREPSGPSVPKMPPEGCDIANGQVSEKCLDDMVDYYLDCARDSDDRDEPPSVISLSDPVGSVGGLGWTWQLANAPSSTGSAPGAGAEPVLVILDDGINRHQKLRLEDPSMCFLYDAPRTGCAGVSPLNPCIADRGDHGTRVAGVAAASVTPGSDLHGIFPGLPVVDFQILNHEGLGTEWTVIRALAFLIYEVESENGRFRERDAIVNLSFALSTEPAERAFAEREGRELLIFTPTSPVLGVDDQRYYSTPEACTRKHRCLARAIDRLAQKGVLVVAGAGNQGRLRAMTAPACLPGVVSVASHNECQQWSDRDPAMCQRGLSLQGSARARPDYLDFAAPGFGIRVINDSALASGTSLASPSVAAALARVMVANPSGGSMVALRRLCTTHLDVGKRARLMDMCRLPGRPPCCDKGYMACYGSDESYAAAKKEIEYRVLNVGAALQTDTPD